MHQFHRFQRSAVCCNLPGAAIVGWRSFKAGQQPRPKSSALRLEMFEIIEYDMKIYDMSLKFFWNNISIKLIWNWYPGRFRLEAEMRKVFVSSIRNVCLDGVLFSLSRWAWSKHSYRAQLTDGIDLLTMVTSANVIKVLVRVETHNRTRQVVV